MKLKTHSKQSHSQIQPFQLEGQDQVVKNHRSKEPLKFFKEQLRCNASRHVKFFSDLTKDLCYVILDFEFGFDS